MLSPSTNPQIILFLAANPKDTGRLRLDQELRDISEGLQRAQRRDQFTLEQRLAVRPRDIQRAILDVEPQIIHFSGHSTGDHGLVFEDEIGNAKLVDGAALAGLFELFADQINCVVLNGCYSELQAKAIAQHIPFVIGMNQAIGDKAAIAFAVGFYDALGAGRDIEFAYKYGCAAIPLEGAQGHLTPILLQETISRLANSEQIEATTCLEQQQNEYEQLLNTVATKKDAQNRLDQGISQLVDALQDTLSPQLKIALAWLSDYKERASIAGKVALKQHNEIQELKDLRQSKRFYKELENCLYRLHFAIFTDNFSPINEVKITFDPRVYKTALDVVENRIPSNDRETIQKFQLFINHLKSRLDITS